MLTCRRIATGQPDATPISAPRLTFGQALPQSTALKNSSGLDACLNLCDGVERCTSASFGWSGQHAARCMLYRSITVPLDSGCSGTNDHSGVRTYTRCRCWRVRPQDMKAGSHRDAAGAFNGVATATHVVESQCCGTCPDLDAAEPPAVAPAGHADGVAASGLYNASDEWSHYSAGCGVGDRSAGGLVLSHSRAKVLQQKRIDLRLRTPPGHRLPAVDGHRGALVVRAGEMFTATLDDTGDCVARTVHAAKYDRHCVPHSEPSQRWNSGQFRLSYNNALGPPPRTAPVPPSCFRPRTNYQSAM